MSTTTKTFSITEARYLGSKVAADLYQLQRFYGSPSNSQITDYVDELVILLKDGYVDSVDYGFRKNGVWVVGVGYEINTFNDIDQSPGRIPVNKDITGASWGSYMRWSQKFLNLSASDRQSIESSLPIARSGGGDPQIGANSTYDKTYGSGTVELKRKTFY